MKTYTLPNNDTTTEVETYLAVWRALFDTLDTIFKPLNLQVCCATYGAKDIYLAYPTEIDSLHKKEDHVFNVPLAIALLMVSMYNKSLIKREN